VDVFSSIVWFIGGLKFFMELTRLPDGQVYALRYTLKYAFGDIFP